MRLFNENEYDGKDWDEDSLKNLFMDKFREDMKELFPDYDYKADMEGTEAPWDEGADEVTDSWSPSRVEKFAQEEAKRLFPVVTGYFTEWWDDEHHLDNIQISPNIFICQPNSKNPEYYVRVRGRKEYAKDIYEALDFIYQLLGYHHEHTNSNTWVL